MRGILIHRGYLPPVRLKDYVTTYDKDGNEYLWDGKEKMSTGQKMPRMPLYIVIDESRQQKAIYNDDEEK